MEYRERFSRSLLLLGEETFYALSQVKVIVFGIGGVGSWCAEGLVRTGIHNLTIVDSDTVSESNINRQLPATTSTVGKPKVEVMREHLLDINPDANIVAIQGEYTETTAGNYNLNDYDYVIDAIDSIKDKITLILNATASTCTFFSAMGAALKTDPLSVRTAEFWKVEGCPLAATLRRRFKKLGVFPSKKFTCVYSKELKSNRFVIPSTDPRKKVTNGSLVQVTSVCGMTLCSLVVNDISQKGYLLR